MAPKYETRAKERIRKGVQKYVGILTEASKKGIKEEDTSVIVHSMITELLGYEAFREVNAQFKVKGRYADWAVYVADELKYFVEVKALGTKLRESHLSQVETYARQKPTIGWAVLTTGDVWQCHRIVSGRESQQFFEVRLLDSAQCADQRSHMDQVVDSLYLLSREAVSRAVMERKWDEAECYRPETLASVMLSDDVLKTVRRLVRRLNPKRRVDIGELREHLVRSVIRGDISPAPLGQPVRARHRRPKGSKPPASIAGEEPPAAEPDTGA